MTTRDGPQAAHARVRRDVPTPAGAVALPGLPGLPGASARLYRGTDDVPGIVDVLHESRRADRVAWLPSVDEVRHEFAHPVNEVPERDALLVERDGRIVAWVRTSWSLRDDGYVYRTFGAVHPQVRRKGIGRALLHWGQRRLREAANGHPDGVPCAFGAETLGGEDGAKALLASDGYRPVRYFAEMHRLLRDPIPAFDIPAGLELRPLASADHRRVFEAQAEAFRDHWGNREWTDADFAAIFSGPNMDASLWQVVWDGDEVAGVIDTAIHAAENELLGVRHGWLEHISVRRPWRGRGLAKTRIVRTMLALRERGMSTAALGVDAENPTGAFGLYESLGFRVADRMEVLRKPLDDELPSAPGR